MGAGESVGAIVDPQLAVDVQNMPLRRAVCDYQPLGDILEDSPSANRLSTTISCSVNGSINELPGAVEGAESAAQPRAVACQTRPAGHRQTPVQQSVLLATAAPPLGLRPETDGSSLRARPTGQPWPVYVGPNPRVFQRLFSQRLQDVHGDQARELSSGLHGAVQTRQYSQSIVRASLGQQQPCVG